MADFDIRQKNKQRKRTGWTGQKFNLLLAVRFVRMDESSRQQMWLFKCDCGTEKILRVISVVSGKTKSCGCYSVMHRHEWLGKGQRNSVLTNATHRLSTTRIYKTYRKMIRRCINPKASDFKWYGGRGISVCAEWLGSAETFYQWAIANGYAETLQIDRINNDGNYEPNNCRWVTKTVNANNTSTNRFLEHDGKRMTTSDWARHLNIPATMITRRLCLGWSVEKALTTANLHSHYKKPRAT